MRNIENKPELTEKDKKNNVLVMIVLLFCVIVIVIALVMDITHSVTVFEDSQIPDIPTETQYVSQSADPMSLERVVEEDAIISSVSATIESERYVSRDTSFIITTKEDLGAETLEPMLELSSGGGFTLKKDEKYKFVLQPNSNLPKGSIINLVLKDEYNSPMDSWAFETEDDFYVKSFYPYDGSIYNSIDTGIEIEFSSYVSKETAKDYFTISPDVSGKFNSYRKTLVFVPDDPLKPDTTYTISLKAGYKSLDGTPTTKDYSSSFSVSDSSQKKGYCYFKYGYDETFINGDMVVLEINRNDDDKDEDVQLNLYKMNNGESYFEALQNYITDSKSLVSVDNLDCVYNYSGETKENPTQQYGTKSEYILLPDNLEQGWYVADLTTNIKGKEYNIQKLIQISPVSVYSSTVYDETVFFVNNALTGNSSSDADITYTIDNKNYSCRTDYEGTAKLKCEASNNKYGVLKVSTGDNVFYTVLSNQYTDDYFYYDYYYYGDGKDKDYITYMYTDRERYLTSDSIYVFGFVTPRFSHSPAVPDNMQLQFGYDETDSIYVPVNLNGDGTFTAKISYKNCDSKYLKLASGEDTIESKYIYISDYVKPTYVIDINTPDFVFLPGSNPIDVSADISFFDGTPAPEVSASVSGYELNSSVPAEIVTDKDGKANWQVTLSDNDTFRPKNYYVSLNLAGLENEYQYAYTSFYAFQRDIMLESDFTDNKDKTGTLDISTYLVDTSNVKAEDLSYSTPTDVYKGNPVDTTVTGTLYCEWYEKNESGSYYDFLEKKTVKKYKYVSRKEKVGTYTVNTKDGKGVFNLPLNRKEASYYIDLSWKDTKGNYVSETEYLYYIYYNETSSGKDNYTFSSKEYTFKENDDIKVTFKNNYNDVEITDKGKIFYTIYSDRFIETKIVDKNEFTVCMTRECIPNVYICGAYFDGKNIYSISNSTPYRFDPADRKINLEITTDKEKYLPSDEVNMTVVARDINGNPVVNSTVSVSVVDEAAFAIMDQIANPLDDIYSYVYYPVARQFTSYIEHNFDTDTMAEKGGGGDEPNPRRDFRDTTAFLTGTTDDNGKVNFKFNVADNLTTWRATVQAVGDVDDGAIYAGTEREPIVVSLPLFINPVMLDTYIYGDDISVSAKCFGSSDEDMLLSVRLTGNNVDKTLIVKPGEPANFGKLEKGEYKVQFSADDGINSDAIELSLNVVDTIIETDITRTGAFKDQKTLDINPTKWPVYLTFYDKQYGFYSNIVYSLLNWSSDRQDMKIADGYAENQLGWITDDEYKDNYRVSMYCGRASILPQAEQSSEFGALVCAVAPELVDSSQISDIYNLIEDDEDITKEDLCSAYLALAGLGEPVLYDVRELIKDNDLSYDSKMDLTLALSLLGDFSTARKYYFELTDNIFIYKQDDEYCAYINDYFDTMGKTKKAILVASVLGIDEANKYARYLTNKVQTDQTYVLELMMYIKNYRPKYDNSAEIQYTLNGNVNNVVLDKFRGTRISFGEEQWKNADIKLVSGDVNYVVMYTGNTNEMTEKPKLNVTKTYTPVKGQWKVGALVKVNVTATGSTIKDPWYCIDDAIPSGARYVRTGDSYWIKREGQRVSGYIYKTKGMQYYIILVNSGEYVVEGALAQDFYDEWGQSARTTIVIED